ncbi:MAG: LamG-like jellyroll fold domain-containing protein [Patescibacteria group bacterium]|nr:LamG-like jellyroll fold domain-containing protein [Patescibacteria group bacterium]
MGRRCMQVWLLTFLITVAWAVPAGAAPVLNPGTWSIYDSSGPAYPGGGTDGTPNSAYAANKMIDGNLSTFAVLVDDTLTGGSTTTIPDYAAAPTTGHVVIDLGQPMLISSLQLFSRHDSGGSYNPRDVSFFYFTNDNPAGSPVIDDIENDTSIRAIRVGASGNYVFPGLANGASQLVAFDGAVATRYLGMRVNSSYEQSGPTHYNFQVGEIGLDLAPLPLSVADVVWHFADLSDSAGGQSNLNPPAGTGAVNVAAATPIAARNSNNLVFDAGSGGTTSTSDHGWIGINPYPGGRSDELTPRLNTSLSVFARVRWTGQFNLQPQPSSTDNDVDDILRFGAVSYKDQDWYALQLYAGGNNTTEAKAQFVFTGDNTGTETTLRHDSTLSLDTWYDITGVFNSDEQTATLYVFDPQSGREVGTAQTITGLSFSSLEDAAGNLLMMVSPSWGEGPNPNAQMDLAAVWHSALTPAQVAYLSLVPEPGAAAMLFIAAGFLLLRRRIV